MDVTDSVAASRQRVVGFADVVRIPLRRWRIVLAVTAAVTLATLAYLLFVPATYRATAVVVLRPVVTDPFTFPSSGADRVINMTAENGIALGNEVLDATAQALSRTSDEIREALSVEVPTGGQVLRFTYAGDSEQEAVAGANAAAETYLRVRESDYQQQRQSQLLSYDSTIRQVTDQRKAAQKGLPGGGNNTTSLPPRTQAVLDQVNALNDQIAQLANQRAKIASADLTPGSITAAARAPVPNSHDGAALFVIAALLGGLLLGMVGAHAREALDRRVRSTDQAADLIGVPTLGVVRGGRRAGGAAAADARYVSLAVLKWIDRHPDRPVVVLSCGDGEGRTVVSGNLAVALAESGQTVHLCAPERDRDEVRRILDAGQLRTPPRSRPKAEPTTEVIVNGTKPGVPAAGVVRLPHTGTRPGTAAVPSQPARDPDETVVMTMPEKPSGPPVTPGVPEPSAEPSGVFIGAGQVRLVALGDEPEEGVVVIDAPPSDTDERGVRAAQDGVALLVVARDRTRNADLARLVERLRSAGAQTIGFVMTGGRGA
jgi:capsular polysaccharide biosynthesis protein